MSIFPRLGSPLSGDNDGSVPESVAAVRDGRVTIRYELNGVEFAAKGRPGTDVYCIGHGDFIDWFDSDGLTGLTVVFTAKGRPGTDVYCIWHGDFIDWFDGDFRK